MPTEGNTTYYTQDNLQPGDWALVPCPRAESPEDLGERAMQLVLILDRTGEGDATTFLTIDTKYLVTTRTMEGLFPHCTEGSARHPKLYAVMPQRPPLDEAFFEMEGAMRQHLAAMSEDTACEHHRVAEDMLDFLHERDIADADNGETHVRLRYLVQNTTA